MSSKGHSLKVNCPSSPSNASHRSSRARSPKSHPISSCGPMDNGFLQCYADLFASAVMYSDPDFQQRLLFPNFPGHAMKPSGEGCKRNYTKCRKSPLQKDSSGVEGQGQSSAKSMNRLRVSFSKHTHPGAHQSPNADADDKDNYLGGGRRRSSMSRAQASVERMQNIPKITLEDNGSCWSSDMDETDTTASDSADESFFSSSIDDDYDDEPDDKERVIRVNGSSTQGGSRSLPEPEDSDLSPNPIPAN